MDLTEPTATDVDAEEPAERTSPDDGLLADDLVEEISIDGMCGVY